MTYLKLIIFVYFIFDFSVSCFNLDTTYPIVYFYNNTQLDNTRLLKNTHFGYSVILYKGEPFNESWIQIGAPKSNDTNNYYFEPGAVFRCPIAKPCQLFPIDASDVNKFSRLVNVGQKFYQPKKDEAWIGGSMDIDKNNERVVVCGHRWINNRTESRQHHITGACYWSKTNENFTTELLPITGNSSNWYKGGVYYHSNGQAGTSVHMPSSPLFNKSLPQIIMGAPGVSNWKGTVLKYEDGRQDRKPYKELFIPEPKNIRAFSYFGYALSSGYFFSSTKLLYVSGAPRASRLKGKILIFDVSDRSQMSIIDFKEGTMTGEYFGAAIAVADINGDGLDDIIVGAPRHTVQMDEGRIYIYYGHIKGSLWQPRNMPSIRGHAIRGQFGSAIQSLADIDLDGYSDIAVGAPYENNNHGVVYIYNGQENREEPLKLSQRIEGKNIYPFMKGFGISFSRPTDIDGNHINDLAIGSYISENAVVLRSRPVVSLKIKRRTHNLILETDTTIFQIGVCFSYNGKFIPERLEVIRKIKMDENNRRVYLLEDKTKQQVEHTKRIILNARQDNCENITFGLSKTTNYLDPIKIIVSQDKPEYSGPSHPILINQYQRIPIDNFCKDCPVVKNSNSVRFDIPYTLNCGADNKCDTDLIVNASFINLGAKNQFIIGSQSFVSLNISVYNKKEDAYLTKIEVKLPENIHLQEVPTNCNEDVKNITIITCDIDNPLKTNATKTIILNFDMSYITNSSKEFLSFNIKAKSKSNELNLTDNSIVTHLNLSTSAFIEIKVNSEKDVYYYENKTQLLNATLLYKIQTPGVSPLNYFKLNIEIPVLLNTMKLKDNDEPIIEKFLSIYQPIGVQGDQSFSCAWQDPFNTIEKKVESLEDVDSMQRLKRSVVASPPLPSKNSTQNNNNTLFIVPINNKVAFINCSSPNIICKNLTCEIGPFQRTLKVASLQIKMELNMTILRKYVLKKDKSIIYLSTDGYVTEINGKRNDSKTNNSAPQKKDSPLAPKGTDNSNDNKTSNSAPQENDNPLAPKDETNNNNNKANSTAPQLNENPSAPKDAVNNNDNKTNSSASAPQNNDTPLPPQHTVNSNDSKNVPNDKSNHMHLPSVNIDKQKQNKTIESNLPKAIPGF